jgi:hypothetical protein
MINSIMGLVDTTAPRESKPKFGTLKEEQMYKIINKYGKTITLQMSYGEKSIFTDVRFLGAVCRILNEKTKNPTWLVNKFNINECKPFRVVNI